MDDFAASVTSAWRKVERRERGDTVRTSIGEMSDRDRMVLVMRGIDAIRFKTIGVQLGISEDAARMAFDRALERLRGRLPRDLITALEGRED